MRIRFNKNDPRRGTEVDVDDQRAAELIASGSAVAVTGAKAEAAPENKAVVAAPENKAAPVAKKATKKAR